MKNMTTKIKLLISIIVIIAVFISIQLFANESSAEGGIIYDIYDPVCPSCHCHDVLSSSWIPYGSAHVKETKCSNCNYFSYDTNTLEAHKGGTHANGGKCTVCGYKYQTHSKSSEIKGTLYNSAGHWYEYGCTHTKCNGTISGTVTNHVGGTHANGGKCTVCGYKYQAHSKSSTIKGYDKTAKQHVPIYACTCSGCTSTYKGSAVNHVGGTHENGGKCTTCGYKYQTHKKTDKVIKYKNTAKQHTPIYKCSHSGCKKTYTGKAVNHTGATHENGGKCTICGYKYQTHKQSTDVKGYRITSKTHIPLYKCSYSGCTKTYLGKAVNHIGATPENGGKCEECGYVYEIYVDGIVISPDDFSVNGEADFDISKDEDNSIVAHIKKTTAEGVDREYLDITISGSGTMRENAFTNLVSGYIINTLTFEDDVTNIADYAFKGCYIKGPVYIPESIETIGKEAFMDVSKLDNNDQAICELDTVFIEGKVQIGEGAFKNCETLIDVNMYQECVLGKGAFEGCKRMKTVKIPNGTTNISENTFKDCRNLYAVIIPETVTSIGNNAFENCANQFAIYGEQESYAQTYATNNRIDFVILTEVYSNDIDASRDGDGSVIASVETIAIRMPVSSSSGPISSLRTNITISGSGVMKERLYEEFATVGSMIGVRINSLTIEEGVTNISKEAFEGLYIDGEVVLPETIETIGENAFGNMQGYFIEGKTVIGLDGVTIEGNTAITDGAFENSNTLESVNINGSATIGKYAFKNCNNLKFVSISEDVTSIEEEAFNSCSTLKAVVIPESVERIEADAFGNCGEDLTIFCVTGSYAERYAIENNLRYTNIDSVVERDIDISEAGDGSVIAHIETTQYRIPISENEVIVSSRNNKVTISGSGVMKKNAFDGENIGNDALTYIDSLIFENGVTNISEGAFKGLYIAGDIIIPETVERIGKQAFIGVEIADGEESEDIPYGIENVVIEGNIVIEESAFENCIDLESVTINGNASIEKNAFKNCKNIKELRIIGDEVSIDSEAFTECDKDNLVIYCRENSDVQQYAIENGYNYEIISEESPVDTISPQLTVVYSTKEPTTDTVLVTIIANEEIEPLEGWIFSSNRKELQKEYDKNTEETVVIQDLAGNTTSETIKITNILPLEDQDEDGQGQEGQGENKQDENEQAQDGQDENKQNETDKNANNQSGKNIVIDSNTKKTDKMTDGAKSYSVLPKTGIGRILIGVALICGAVSVIFYRKYKRID